LSYQNGSSPWKVTLTVEDSSGLFDTISQMVSPQVYPKFTFQPMSPSSGETVIFNGSATSFSGLIGSPSNTTKGYSWNFGDGTSGSGAILSHVFSAMGLYRVVLTVSTAYGLGEASKTVSVGADPPAAPSVGGGGGRPPLHA
jgi:PKD repeat protein